uniref:Sulfhydryl oxidase n=1 Tax=Trypanosoma congolense (strain IL3000) TaxID=1068625 RepID=G0UTU4_TRYCI|nr:unnamed protein product [Trypanosoma congolense IL3000]
MGGSTDNKPLSNIPGECPTPRELGKAGWTILHSAAAVFPYNPTPPQKEAFANFLHSWSQTYACSHCGYHMRRYLEHKPPVVTDKLAVNRYLCEFHNAVNERVGKPVYDCDPMNVLRRWHPTFPDMEDQPTIEEQAESLKLRENSKEKVGTGDRWSQGSPGKLASGSAEQSTAAAPQWATTASAPSRPDIGLAADGWGKEISNRSQRLESAGSSTRGDNTSTWWWRRGDSKTSSTVLSDSKGVSDMEASVTSVLSS